MKNSILITVIGVFSCVFMLSACSSSSGKDAQSKTASMVSSAVSSTVEQGSSVVSSVQSAVENIVVNDKYDEWTYATWNAATDSQKEGCRSYYSSQVGAETTRDSLTQIFEKNQNKNLASIISENKQSR